MDSRLNSDSCFAKTDICSILLYHRFGLDVQNYVELEKFNVENTDGEDERMGESADRSRLDIGYWGLGIGDRASWVGCVRGAVETGVVRLGGLCYWAVGVGVEGFGPR